MYRRPVFQVDPQPELMIAAAAVVIGVLIVGMSWPDVETSKANATLRSKLSASAAGLILGALCIGIGVFMLWRGFSS